MMGFSFLATVVVFLISSPLVLLFSPLLLFAAAVLVGALTGLGAGGDMALAGIASLVWFFQGARAGGTLALVASMYEEKVEEGGGDEEGQDGYLQQNEQSPNQEAKQGT
ncbi:hypothetical protein NMG60_11002023 [Bertholletia excelsa]